MSGSVDRHLTAASAEKQFGPFDPFRPVCVDTRTQRSYNLVSF